MSEVKVNKISPRSGTTVTLGDNGDTISIPSGVTLDASSGGLAGTLTTAAQPNITSVGTLTSFTSTGIDDNATSTAITIDSSGSVGIGTSSPSAELHISKSADAGNAEFLIENSFATAGSTDEIVQIQGRFGGFDASYIITGKEADFTTSGNRSSFMSFWTRGAGTLAEAMRINSSGNVGIGTASPGAKLEIQTGSDWGNIINSTYAGTQYLQQFEYNGTSIGKIRGDNSSISIESGSNLILQIANTEVMRINNSGNVGIGTSSPSRPLDVVTSNNLPIRTESSAATNYLQQTNSGGTTYIASTGDNFFIATGSGGTERMRIDSTGNVGIGTTSPGVKLQILGTENAADTQAIRLMENATQGAFIKYDGIVNELQLGGYNSAEKTGIRIARGDATTYFNTNGSERMRIDSSGNVGIGTTSAQGKLHIMKNDASALIDGNADTLFLENTTSTGLTIGSSTTGEGAIQFSDSDDADVGKIQYAHSSNLMTFRTNGANRMFIDSSGNVGIGTSSPDCKLEVDAGTTASVFAPAMIITSSTGGAGGATPIDLRHSTNSSSGFRIQISGSAGSNNAILNLIENSAMIFATNNTQRMRIDNVGRILINTTSHIGNSPYLNIANTYTNSGMAIKSNTANAHHAIEFHNTNGQVGFINTSGTSTVYSTSSDYRLKENVVEMTNATDRLKQLQPKRFNFIADEDTTVDGFLAHEVSNIVPEAISGEKDATKTKEKVVVDFNGNIIAENIEQADWETGKIADENGNTEYPIDSTWEATKVVPVYQGIDQSKLVPLLVKTIQELENRITTLENA
jgi:hypothetical protein